jgi:ribonuclease HI
MSDNLKIYCDGGARGNPGPGASAFVVEKEEKIIFKQGKYLGRATNNIAEYQGVLMAMHWLKENLKKTEEIIFVLDSELVVNQLSGKFKIKNENLRNLFYAIKEIEKTLLVKIFYQAVPRDKNKLADLLVNQTLDENLK